MSSDTDKEEEEQSGTSETANTYIEQLIAEYSKPEYDELNAQARAQLQEINSRILGSYQSPVAQIIESIRAATDNPMIRQMSEIRSMMDGLKPTVPYGLLESIKQLNTIPDAAASFSLMNRIASLTQPVIGFRSIADQVASQMKLNELTQSFNAVHRLSPVFNGDLGQHFRVSELIAESIRNQQSRAVASLYGTLSELEIDSAESLANATEKLIHEAPEKGQDEPPARQVVLATVGRLQAAIDMLAENPEERFTIDDRVFEELIAELLERDGYKTKLTKKSRDGGRDVIAYSEGFLGRQVVQIECKRYAAHRTVGEPIVQRVIGVVECYDATSGLVVTTADFSKPAKELQRRKPHIVTLRNGVDMIEWLRALRGKGLR